MQIAKLIKPSLKSMERTYILTKYRNVKCLLDFEPNERKFVMAGYIMMLLVVMWFITYLSHPNLLCTLT